MIDLNKIILKNIPNQIKLRKKMKEELNKRKKLIQELKEGNNPPKKNKKEDINLSDSNQKLEKDSNKKISKKVKFGLNVINKRKSNSHKKRIETFKSEKQIKKLNILDNNEKHNYIYQTINHINISLNNKNNSNIIKENNDKSQLNEEDIDNKELNIIPYTQALRIDKRNYFQIFLSVISHEIKIINAFYYKHPFEHNSIILAKYIFELCLDLTLNCILYTEDVISEKYNNNGSIKFFTTLSLSFISNIITSIISYFISKLAEHVEFLEFIIKDVNDKSFYFLNILRFKKLLCINLGAFFFIQSSINIGMCYYLMIFCTVYHKTQGSIAINYITGISESLAISLGLALITSILRIISIKCELKYIYYTSKYFFENF